MLYEEVYLPEPSWLSAPLTVGVEDFVGFPGFSVVNHPYVHEQGRNLPSPCPLHHLQPPGRPAGLYRFDK